MNISSNNSILLNPIVLNIGLAKHNADWNYSNISSPFFRIYLVLEGEAWLTMNGRKHRLSPNKMYLIPPYAVHDDSCDGHFVLYYIHVYENNDKNLCVFEEYDFPVEVDATSLDEQIINRLLSINPHFELIHYDPKSYSSDSVFFQSIAKRKTLEPYVLMQSKGIVNYLLSCFLESAEKSNLNNDSRIFKAAQYIREHLNTKLTLKEIADHCNISKDHLIRLFKRDLSTTPIAYINKKKIERAQLQLIMKKYSIKDIAYSLSFDNLSYFNRVFKDIVGKTPTEYKSGMQKVGIVKEQE